MLVQIFEVQTREEAAALVQLGVDHIGVLVGDGAFPRELSITPTKAIFTAVPAGHKRVALSLSADLEQVTRVIEETKPDIVQVAGRDRRRADHYDVYAEDGVSRDPNHPGDSGYRRGKHR